jgi:predicted acetyltransferase
MNEILQYQKATLSDVNVLADLNHQLIRDEGHRNPMTAAELAERMRLWLAGEYTAVLFQDDEMVLAYALYREQLTEIYLRQFFVARSARRRGIGRQAIHLLRTQLWPPAKRITVEVLVGNAAAIAFWRSVGFADYALTLEMPSDGSATG